jgi:HEAT repeat protein
MASGKSGAAGGVAPRSRLEYMARKLAEVEAERACAVGAGDVACLLEELRSPDEQVRARAVRAVCPCRMPWEVFEQLRKPVQRLRRDPSPAVRRLALHAEEDARMVAALEALRERAEDFSENERARRRGRRVSEARP